MTTLEGRPNTALLVIDAQHAILAETAGRDGVDAHTTVDRTGYGGPPGAQVIALANL